MADEHFRLRVAHAKSGRLRFLSHLELSRAWERSVRRARLPFSVTQGFNQRIKMAFGPALPVGTASTAEYYDVWLDSYVPAEEALARLTGATPELVGPAEAAFVPLRAPSLAAALTIARYEVILEGGERAADVLESELGAVVADGTFAVEHKGKSKVFDLVRTLPKEPQVRSVEGRVVVEVTTRMGEHGSLRPDALVVAAIERSRSGATVMSVTRTGLFIEDGDGFRTPI